MVKAVSPRWTWWRVGSAPCWTTGVVAAGAGAALPERSIAADAMVVTSTVPPPPIGPEATAPVASVGSATRVGRTSTSPPRKVTPAGSPLNDAISIAGRPTRPATASMLSPGWATTTW